MVVYLVLGLVWGGWLEWYTTDNLEVKINSPWTWRERFFHTLLWPFSFSIFLYEFFKNLF